VFVFRPDTPGDYSAGTFIMLLDDFKADVRSITLVETDTMVGATLLSKGTFLFSDGGNPTKMQVFSFVADDIGATPPTGAEALLIDGLDIGFDKGFSGLELIETTTTVGGTTLASGTILVTVDGEDGVGDNNLAVTRQDVFYLTVTST